jgi:hypothetical protein
MYDILSLINSILLTADMILLRTKNPVPNSWFSFPFSLKNVYSPAGTVPLPSYLTSCTPTKSNLYLDSSLETVVREPGLYKLLMFHVPNLMSIFLGLGRLSKDSVQWLIDRFRNKLAFYGEVLLAPHPFRKLEDHPLSFVCGYLFNIFAANLHC